MPRAMGAVKKEKDHAAHMEGMIRKKKKKKNLKGLGGRGNDSDTRYH